MISFFPTPYPDELLYSVIARYHSRSGNAFITPTIEALFNSKRITAVVDFPCRISILIANISSICDITFEEFVYNNTLFPLFKPFWTQSKTDIILNIMKSKSSRSAHLKSGIYSYSVPRIKHLRFCPMCLSEDEEKYGESYWHRLHQVPGVLICAKHNMLLEDSKVRTYEVHPQNYYVANRVNCGDERISFALKSSIPRMYLEITKNVEFVLENRLHCNESEILREKYIYKLREYGLVSQKGQVDQKQLVQGFISYYTPELLKTIGMMPDSDNPHNWVSLMVRKYNELPHPLKHILLSGYLYKNQQDFYEGEYEKRIFGNGPFPCLNVAAEHYLKNTIPDYESKYSRNKKEYGVFSCDCGFIYERSETHKYKIDKYKYSTIRSYGNTWDKKFRELVEVKQLHLREVAKLLLVDLKTVRKHISRLNLNTMWMSQDAKKKFDFVINEPKEEVDNVIERYRQSWISLIEMYPNYSRAKLKIKDSTVYNWIYYHDKQWFLDNSPRSVIHDKAVSKIDWGKRDEEVKQKIVKVIHYYLYSDEKPCRLTIDLIGKELGYLYLLRNHLNKLPISKVFLDENIETKDQFMKRKIKWAVKNLMSKGEELKEWKVRQAAGVYGIYMQEITDAMMSAINNALL